jgi:hypothetical protein
VLRPFSYPSRDERLNSTRFPDLADPNQQKRPVEAHSLLIAPDDLQSVLSPQVAVALPGNESLGSRQRMQVLESKLLSEDPRGSGADVLLDAVEPSAVRGEDAHVKVWLDRDVKPSRGPKGKGVLDLHASKLEASLERLGGWTHSGNVLNATLII